MRMWWWKERRGVLRVVRASGLAHGGENRLLIAGFIPILAFFVEEVFESVLICVCFAFGVAWSLWMPQKQEKAQNGPFQRPPPLHHPIATFHSAFSQIQFAPEKIEKLKKKKLFGKLKNWKLACQYFTDKQHSKIDFDFCISIICCLCCCTTCCALLLQIYAFQQAVKLIFFRIFLGGRRGYGNWSILEEIRSRIRLW